MVSALGPTMVNIFIGYIELKVISALKNKLLYFRYDDNCFVLVRSNKIIDEFLNILNKAYNFLSFTME